VIRLLLSDDHPVVRAGIRALLESEADLHVVAEAATAEDAVRLAAASDVDLVLMDLQFPGAMQGAEATRRIRAHAAAPRVLVLTNYDTDADILGAIEAGASGYLLKDAPPTELVAAVRAGIRALLETEADLEVVAEAATAEDAVRLAAASDVDLVLMDLQFPGAMQGAEATRRIRSHDAAPRVLVLTNYDTDADILGAIEAGASGYLLKDAPPAELVAAVRAAAVGESALAPAVSSRLDASLAVGGRLTVREAEVLSLVADGRSNRDIGRELFLSEATVKSHLVHVFTKLGVGSRTAAVARARELGAIRAG